MLSHLPELHRFVLQELVKEEESFPKTFVDCGCGNGVWGFLYKVATLSRKESKDTLLIGLDLDFKCLIFCKRHKIYDCLIRADVRYLPLRCKTIDILLASELIEHLKKEDGYLFLKEVERVCRGIIVITTPNGYLPMPTHISGWSPKEFKKLKYKVHGIGLKYAKLHFGKLPKWFRGTLAYISTPISYIVPELSEVLICIKEIKIK